MFKVGRVSARELLEIARLAEGSEPTYAEQGATLAGAMPDGFRHDHYEIRLSDCEDAFERGRDGLQQWAAHRGAGLAVEPHRPPAAGATVAVAAPTGPVAAIAVCRIIEVVDEVDRYGFAYGTLPGHPERGEEAFVVERRGDLTVFMITTFSRPAEPLARLGGPITRRIQQATSHRYLEALKAFVNGYPIR